MKQIVISKNDSGQRLDKYLEKAFSNLPKSLIYKYLRLKRIKVNGKRASFDYKTQEGDRLELYINDELLESAQMRSLPYDIVPNLDIVFEDEHIILLNKPQGLLCHDDDSGEKNQNTLINHLLAYLSQSGQWAPEDSAAFTPALCNRIDRNTGGIVIAAKTGEALRTMNEKIKQREVKKFYYCLVFGAMEKKSGVYRDYIQRDRQEKRVYVTKSRKDGALTAELSWRVIDCRQGISLLECELLTGRTHQIRAQMAHYGHPLLGDTKYGSNAQNKAHPLKYQALCSHKVTFDFKGEPCALDYLNGRSFSISDVPFMPYFLSL